MIYLDSAAVVKLVHAEAESAALRVWLGQGFLLGPRRAGTSAQATKMPMLAETPTEVLETMFHCVPSDAYPYSASRLCRKYPSTWAGANPSQMSACSARIHS